MLTGKISKFEINGSEVVYLNYGKCHIKQVDCDPLRDRLSTKF